MRLPSPSSAEAVVAITDLSRRFGAKIVLNDVSLYVPRGSVFGLVGENGAGNTTLIKHILGLLRAETGTVRVFSLDPVADPVAVLGNVGYLSEQPDLPGWMRVEELLRYAKAFYPNWDKDYAEKLRAQFGLDPMVRHDILEAVIRTVADEGRTVFFSSHLLEEIERVSDQIAMLHHGRIVFCGSLDEIKARHRR